MPQSNATNLRILLKNIAQWLWPLLALISIALATVSYAFDPDAPDYGHSYITRSISDDPGYKPFATVPHASIPHFTATKTTKKGIGVRSFIIILS